MRKVDPQITMDKLGEALVEMFSHLDIFNEVVGEEVDEILDVKLESMVEKTVDREIERAVDIEVENQLQQVMDDYESPLDERLEKVENTLENFDAQYSEEVKALQDGIDNLILRIQELENNRWQNRLYQWWNKARDFLSFQTE